MAQLSPEQLHEFHHVGYTVLRGAISADHVGRMRDDMWRLMSESSGVKPGIPDTFPQAGGSAMDDLVSSV